MAYKARNDVDATPDTWLLTGDHPMTNYSSTRR
jgi:hypothetical protein